MTQYGAKPIYPITAPGMPYPGSDFIDEANLLAPSDSELVGKGKNKQLVAGKALQALLYDALYGEGRVQIAVTSKGTTKTRLPVICGHRWSANPRGRSPGPEPCDVMVVGKMLGDQEINYGRCFVGPTGQLLLDSLAKLGVTTEASRWYVTNLVKTTNPDPAGQWRESYVKTFLHLLHQELRIVRPKYILCLGSDALKGLFGKSMTVAKSEGCVLELDIDLRTSETDTENGIHRALVMGCVHPAAVLRTPDLQGKMEQSLARFVQLVHGTRWDRGEEDLDHRIIDNEDDLRALVQEIRSLGAGNIIAADAEWHGQSPVNPGAYLRTIQVSWKHKSAACIVLNGVGGVPAFRRRVGDSLTTDGGLNVALDLIREIFRDNRPCGHYFGADLEWLVHYGLGDIAKWFAPPDDWRDCKTKGGLDTALMAHAVDETGDFSLTAQALQRTSAPRYDVPLIKWKEQYCRENGLKAKELEGYGMCPDSILYPYALFDACVTRRIAIALIPELDSDRFGNNCWEAFWISQRAVLGVLEMKLTGIPLDRKRVDEMTGLYLEQKQALADRIRRWARWPDLNLESVYAIRELLFGACYNGSRTPDGKIIKLRPKGARTIGAVPLITTEKRPRAWTDLTVTERREFSPSTNKTSLGMMVHYGENLPVRTRDGIVRRNCKDIVQLVRDYRFTSQVLKSVLRKPLEDDNGLIKIGNDGYWQYGGGIAGTVCGDGRVRTTIYQTKETGRWSSARPPLQNCCVDGDTEVLTERGWIRMSEFYAGEQLRIAQYWPDTREIDFVYPEQHRFEYSGPMVQLLSTQTDLLATPNHRCLLRRRKTKQHFEVLANDMPCGTDNRWLHAGHYAGGKESLSAAEVGWLAAVQADGSYVDGVAGGAIRFQFLKPRKAIRLRSILAGLIPESAFRYFVRDYGDGVERHIFYVSSAAEAARPVVQLAMSRLGPRKEWGPWLLKLNRATLDLLCEEVLHWDGLFSRGTSFSSSDKTSADWIQIVWTLSGIRARQRAYQPANKAARIHYSVDIPARGRRRDCTEITRLVRSDVPHNGPIYCVTVPSSYFVVRRNGKVSITGNSKRREPDYKRILGDRYPGPLRAILRAPEGHVLVEADYIGAELFAMAALSGDPTMLEHARRNQLPENHPDYYDIHSNVCVLAFGFDCPPTKAGLAGIGKKHMRVVAKSVLFGSFGCFYPY